MKNALMILVTGLLLVCFPNDYAAQEKMPIQKKVDEKVDVTLMWSKLSPESKRVVKGAPYSAVGITEFTQTLSDGNQIVRKNQSTYYRDSEGRVRIERKLTTLGAWTTSGDSWQFITISDPVTGYYYHLDENRKVARRSWFPDLEEKKRLKEKKELVKIQTKPGKLDWDNPPDPAIEREKSKQRIDDDKKTESLGEQVIEGVRAEGERTTRVIPAGEIGNTLPIEIVDERWYSPELQIVVKTRHSDPRSGESTYRLTNVNRNEPDRSLFQVPSDYTIVNEQRVVPKPVPRPAAPPNPQPGAAPSPQMGALAVPQPAAAPSREVGVPSAPKPPAALLPQLGVPAPQPRAAPLPEGTAPPAPQPATPKKPRTPASGT